MFPTQSFCDNSGRIAVSVFYQERNYQRHPYLLQILSMRHHLLVKLRELMQMAYQMQKMLHFSLEAHVRSVEGRVSALEVASRSRPNKDEFKHFVANELRHFWNHTKLTVNLPSHIRHWDSMRCFLSPSDFGFHNILHSEGGLNFLDFEYAGRDDLAKLLSDFRLCPEIKVKKKYTEIFCKNIIDDLELDKGFEKRLEILTNLGRVKWLCIVLNVFLPNKTEEFQMLQAQARSYGV